MEKRAGFIMSAPLVIGIMAFAVVAFLFLIDTAINPDGTTNTNSAVIVNQAANTNTAVNQNSNTEGTFSTNTSLEIEAE